MLNLIRNILKLIVLILLLVAAVQISSFAFFGYTDTALNKADLIIAFPGEKERMPAAQALIEQGHAANLLVIKTTSKQPEKKVKHSTSLKNVNIITDDKSRSTFEDVYVTKKTIEKHNYTSVILVTSSYHMPRALFLLKSYLFLSRLKVDVQYFPVNKQEGIRRLSDIKPYCNEIIKLWGSLAEMTVQLTTDRLLNDSNLFKRISKTFKKNLLLD